MDLITKRERIAILDSILSDVNHNYPPASTSNNFTCCEVTRRYFCKMKYEGPYCLFLNDTRYFDYDLNSLKKFQNLKKKK